jgi:hypothetical protein
VTPIVDSAPKCGLHAPKWTGIRSDRVAVSSAGRVGRSTGEYDNNAGRRVAEVDQPMRDHGVPPRNLENARTSPTAGIGSRTSARSTWRATLAVVCVALLGLSCTVARAGAHLWSRAEHGATQPQYCDVGTTRGRIRTEHSCSSSLKLWRPNQDDHWIAGRRNLPQRRHVSDRAEPRVPTARRRPS